jgi:hypothetical protein
MGIIQSVFRNLREMPGWHTSRKLVVIESDDWGVVRMPAVKIYQTLKNAGLDVENDPFARFDSLATVDDLSALFEALHSVRDMKGNPALITANCAVANPDFSKIKSFGFSEYHFEFFTESLKKQRGCEQSFKLWQEGISAGLFKPQYHGREHLNVSKWMNLLQNGHKEVKKAFDHGVFGVNFNNINSKRANLMAAFDYENNAEKQTVHQIAEDGAQIFRQLFGYSSFSFIAPSYVWDPGLEKAMALNGARVIQGINTQSIPSAGSKYKYRYHFTGQKNKLGQVFLARNCFFEPSIKPDFDWIGVCLKRMEMIFRWRRPVILGSHRLNFIGALAEDNRNRNLVLFKKLLNEITKKWPDVEFVSSDNLGKMML